MNILIIANKFPYPTKDGGSIATMNLAMGLHKANHNISILAMNTSKHYFDIQNLPVHISEKVTFYSSFINSDLNPFHAFVNQEVANQDCICEPTPNLHGHSRLA